MAKITTHADGCGDADGGEEVGGDAVIAGRDARKSFSRQNMRSMALRLR